MTSQRILTTTLTFAALLLGPTAAATAAPPERGAVVSVERIAQLSRDQVGADLSEIGFDSPAARYGVDAYRVAYRTVSVTGRPTTASTLVALPRSGARTLRVVVQEHGTTIARRAAPSSEAGGLNQLTPFYFAAAGYAAVGPDYLGLGLGPGPHPYLHARSEATASVDALRAARTLAARQHRHLDGRTLVTGFSQGAQAAMALGRALDSGADPSLRLAALAPVSGPYALEHAALPAIFAGDMDPVSATFYLAYFAVTWKHLYGIYDRPAEVFLAPYDQRIEELLDGSHDTDEVFGALPRTPEELFTADFLDRLRTPTGALARGLRENDTTCSWTPRAPVRLYAARGDRDVTIANARACQRALRAHGAAVPLVDVGAIDHFPSAFTSTPRVLDWFQSIAPAR